MSLESGEMVAEEKKKQSATFWTGRLTWQDKHETRSLSRCCHEPINKVNAPRFLRRPPICAIADVCCCNHGAQLIVGNKFRIQVDSVLNLSDRWRFSASQVYLGIVKNCSLFGPTIKSTFTRACAAVRGFSKNQKLRKNSSGIAENTTGKVLLRGVF